MKYKTVDEIMITGTALGKIEPAVDEISIHLLRNKYILNQKILSAADTVQFLRNVYFGDRLHILPHEEFWIMYLNCANKIIGIYNLGKGGITATVADPIIAFSIALKTLAVAMILSHNHPSGNAFPSVADKSLTKRFMEMGKIHGIKILDHLIIAEDSYYSFANEGDDSLSGITHEITALTNINDHIMITKENIAQNIASIEEMKLPEIVKQTFDQVKILTDDFTDWSDFNDDKQMNEKLEHLLDTINKADKNQKPVPVPAIIPAPVAVKVKKEHVKKERIKKEHVKKVKSPKPVKEDAHEYVEAIDPAVRFIKRYVRLDGKTLHKEDILRIITPLQRAIRTHQIRQQSKYADNIIYIQHQLLRIWNKHRNSGAAFKLDFDAKDQEIVNTLKDISVAMKVRTDISLIKRFISLEGKSDNKVTAKKLYADLVKTKVSPMSKYWAELNEIKDILDRYLNGSSDFDPIRTMSFTLDGLMGLGMLDYDNEVKKGDLVKTYDNVRGRVVKIHENSIEIDTNPGHYYAKKKVKVLEEKQKFGCKDLDCLNGLEDGQIMNSTELVGMEFHPVGFTGKWLELIGDPVEPWKLMCWSKPGKGKSTLMIELAKYLAETHGRKVLFVAKEEGFNSTLKDKFVRLDATDPLISISSELPLNLQDYNYVFIDSVTAFKLSSEDLSELIKKYPSTSFMFIFQATIDGGYRGNKEVEHIVDVSIYINESGYATAQKTRFGGSATINIFPGKETPAVYKFTNLQDAEKFMQKPENSGGRIVFGDDGKYWVTNEKNAIKMRQNGFGSVPLHQKKKW